MENLNCEEVETTLPKPANVSAEGEKKRFQCAVCDQYFSSDLKLQKHVRLQMHINVKIYDSPYSRKKYEHPMKKHVVSCSEMKFRCPKCAMKFSSMEKLNAHEKKHYIKKFPCDECLETFTSRKLLNAHSKIHEQRFFVECEFCETICMNEDSLKEHLNSHTLKKAEESDAPKKNPRIKNLKCKRCRQRFKNECKLKQHMLICYLSELSCDKCGGNYATKIGLNKHVCRMKDVVYKCNVCNEAFSKKDDLFKHFFIHKSTQGMDVCM